MLGWWDDRPRDPAYYIEDCRISYSNQPVTEIALPHYQTESSTYTLGRHCHVKWRFLEHLLLSFWSIRIFVHTMCYEQQYIHFVTTPQSEDREEQREKELSTARSWEGSWPPPGFINKKGMQMFCTLFEKKSTPLQFRNKWRIFLKCVTWCARSLFLLLTRSYILGTEKLTKLLEPLLISLSKLQLVTYCIVAQY